MSEKITMGAFARDPHNYDLAKMHLDDYMKEHPEAWDYIDGQVLAYQDVAMWVYLGYSWEEAVEHYIQDAKEWAEAQDEEWDDEE